MLVDWSRRGLQTFSPGELASQTGAETAVMHVTGLNLSHNSLGSVHGLQGFTHLTVLDLSFNGLTSLDGGLPLGLVSLNLSHNSLSSLQGGALYPLQQLEVLNVACNRLVDLRGVSSGSGTVALRVVDASGNQLSTLNGLERCRGIEELHVECNLIKEAANVASLRQLPRLRSFLLKDNPILLRKRQVQALYALLPPSVAYLDAPAPSTVPSVNTSTVSASTAATAVEIEELRRQSANTSADTAKTTRPSVTDSRRTATGWEVVIPQTQATPVRSGDAGSTPGRAESRTGSGGKPRSRRMPGTSPLSGVGGEEVSPSCPRKSLPGTPPPIPPLQPYYVPPPGASPSQNRAQQHQQALVDPAEARMLRSALLERVVGSDVVLPFSKPPLPTASPALLAAERPQTKVAAAPAPAANTSVVSSRSAQAFEDVTAERDAYKRQVHELTEEMAALQRALILERENTAVVLCINEQLQQRLQRLLSGGTLVDKPHADAAPPVPAAMPPLAPPPGPLPPAPSRISRSPHADGVRNTIAAHPSPCLLTGHVETVEMDSIDESTIRPAATLSATSPPPPPVANGEATATQPNDNGTAKVNAAAFEAQRQSLVGRQAEALTARRKAAMLMAKLRPAATAAMES